MNPIQTFRRAVAALFVSVAFLAFAGTASAATLVVNDDAAGSGPAGVDCSTSTFTSVQAAVNAAAIGDTIAVCAGTYVEQPEITKPITVIGAGDASIIRAPASASIVTRYTISGVNFQPVVHVAADNVIIRDLQVDGDKQGNVNGTFLYMGISALNRTGVEIHDSLVTNIQKTPFDGVQTGFAIRIDNTDGVTRTAVIEGNRLTEYQKGGIVIRGLGLDGTITGNVIEGVGEQTDIAQNGISFGRGMSGVIEDNVILNNLCNQASCGPDPATQAQSAGLIMVVAAGPQGGNVTIKNNIFENNDTGVISSVSDGSTRTLTGNDLSSNRYIGLYVEDGLSQAAGNRITGNPRGIVALSRANGLVPDLELTGNNIAQNGRGVTSIQVDPGLNPPPAVSGDHNRIVGNTTAGVDNTSTGTFDFENNWWGCNEGPGQPGCDSILGLVDANPWLVLEIAANPTTLTEGDESQITATVTRNSDGVDTGSGFPDNQSVAFATDFGVVSPPNDLTASGQAESTLTADDPGQAIVQATLDNETVSTGPIVFEAAPPLVGCSNLVPGTPGDDDLLGTALRDRITGKAGADSLRGFGARDCLRGGSDDDLVKGGRDRDRVGGGAGADELRGQSGDDKLKGGPGTDVLFAGAGDDQVRSTDIHSERIDCGAGDDRAVVDGDDRVVRCERVRRV